MDRKSIINFDITTGNYSSFVNHIVTLAHHKESANVCVANVHMFIEAYKDASFNRVINDATVVTPDGKPLTWVLRYLYGIRQDRVAGNDRDGAGERTRYGIIPGFARRESNAKAGRLAQG